MKIEQIPTPAYVVDETRLTENLKILDRVQKESGCKILLAQKAFSMFYEYPLIGKYLCGTTASGLYEARLGKEEMGKENHVFAPAFRENEIDELADICDHIVFNSVSQLKKYGPRCLGRCSVGLRINPEYSTQKEHAIYDPCAPGSRLGVTLANLRRAVEEHPDVLAQVDGFHIHTLCEQNSDDLVATFEVFERNFSQYFGALKWINLGGGHHITKSDYDVDRLVELIRYIRKKYDVEVYLEPGEAVALNAGYLVTEVLDIVDNGIKTLILDASAACHMPDVLEMPYRPPLQDAGEKGEKRYDYRLSSYTCLAGDIIGDYSFDRPVQVGERLYFLDMAIYSMVKNNTFNGIGLPSIYARKADGECVLVKAFDYKDFKERLS